MTAAVTTLKFAKLELSVNFAIAYLHTKYSFLQHVSYVNSNIRWLNRQLVTGDFRRPYRRRCNELLESVTCTDGFYPHHSQ